MILIDTSAWVEFLRGTGSPANHAVRAAISGQVLCCGPVRMEVLAGARDDRHLRRLHGLLARTEMVQTTPADFDVAAQLHRICRSRGETVRNLIDCLIAAHAVRVGVPILHRDADFEVLARHTDTQVVRVGA